MPNCWFCSTDQEFYCNDYRRGFCFAHYKLFGHPYQGKVCCSPVDKEMRMKKDRKCTYCGDPGGYRCTDLNTYLCEIHYISSGHAASCCKRLLPNGEVPTGLERKYCQVDGDGGKHRGVAYMCTMSPSTGPELLCSNHAHTQGAGHCCMPIRTVDDIPTCQARKEGKECGKWTITHCKRLRKDFCRGHYHNQPNMDCCWQNGDTELMMRSWKRRCGLPELGACAKKESKDKPCTHLGIRWCDQSNRRFCREHSHEDCCTLIEIVHSSGCCYQFDSGGMGIHGECDRRSCGDTAVWWCRKYRTFRCGSHNHSGDCCVLASIYGSSEDSTSQTTLDEDNLNQCDGYLSFHKKCEDESIWWCTQDRRGYCTPHAHNSTCCDKYRVDTKDQHSEAEMVHAPLEDRNLKEVKFAEE